MAMAIAIVDGVGLGVGVGFRLDSSRPFEPGMKGDSSGRRRRMFRVRKGRGIGSEGRNTLDVGRGDGEYRRDHQDSETGGT